MNNKLYISYIIGLLLYTSIGLQAQESQLCEVPTISHNRAEVLTYKIYYNWGFLWIPAGEVYFKTIENDDFYEFEASGRTFRAYDPVFKVRDYFYSKVDKQTLKPISFKRSVKEGKYSQHYSTEFDFENSIAYTQKGINKATAQSLKLEIDGDCVQDMLSLMYRLREMDLFNIKKGHEVAMDLFLDNEIYPLDLKFDKTVHKKSIKNLGKYDVQKLVVNLIAGDIFKEEDKMILWVSKDKNNIPLQIESPISVGSIKAVLTSYNGLQYELGE